MLRVGRAALLLALLVAQGCWLQTGWGAQRRAYNDLETEVTADNVADLDVRWTAQVGGAAHEALLHRDQVFVTADNEVAALRSSTGAEIWSESVGDPAGAAVVQDRLWVPLGCQLGAFDLATGDATFVRHGEEPPEGFQWSCVDGDALAVGSRVFVPWLFSVPPIPASPICRLGIWTYGPGISSVDTGTSSAEWERSQISSGCLSGPPPGCCFPPSGVPSYGDVSYDGTSVVIPRDQTLYALPADCPEGTCTFAWTVDVGGRIVGPAVALVSGDLAVPISDGRVVVVDGETHQISWTAQVDAPLAQPLAADASTIFAAASDGTVAAFPTDGCGAATCAAGWTASLSSPASARPSVAGDVLYVGSADGTVTALSAAGCGASTCDALWTGTTPAEVTGAPAIFAGTVVVGSSDGTVTALSAAGCGASTCDALWTGTTPAEVTGAPAIFAGTVVVGSSDGTVTAFALP
jgi:outer membrane protein assembly factor BamB